MSAPDNLKDVIRRADCNAPDAMRRRIWKDIADSLHASRAAVAGGTPPTMRRLIMRSPITKYATAAVVLLGAALLIHFLGGAPDGASVTFGQMVAQIREFRPYAFTSTRRFHESGQAEVRRVMVLNEYQRREEFPDGDIWIFDLSREPAGLRKLYPATKQAVWETFADAKPRPVNPSILERLRRYEENPDAYRVLDRGIQEMEGRKTKCFQVSLEPQMVDTVWVDIETKLPVRTECERPALKDTLIMTEFDFAPQLDARQFDRVPPPGYTLAEQVESKAPSISAQAAAFRPRAYTLTAQDKDGTIRVSRVLEPGPNRRREEYADGMTMIYDFSQSPCGMLQLDTGNKQATLETYPNRRPMLINPDLLDILQKAQAAPVLYKIEDRGLQAIDGHTTRCLYVAGPRNEVQCTFWADTGTGLPVRAEMKRSATLILTNFEFDIPFDSSLFELKAPAGYTLTEAAHPAQGGQTTEAHLLAGLRATAQFMGGAFPHDLDWPKIQEQMRAYILANKVEVSPEQLKDLREALEPFLEYVKRLRSSPESFDLHYAGSGAHLGEAQAMILWYRPQGTRNYHVVYGDLRVEEASPESLPQK